jgi:MoxR-like ATPase
MSGEDLPESMVFRGDGRAHIGIKNKNRLPDPPPWRKFAAPPPHDPVWDVPRQDDPDLDRRIGPKGRRGGTLPRDQVERVNAAIMLRRPLLVSGKPGSGKSSLAYSIAYELGLGRVLRWPITSRTTLQDGLYTYDAVGRLQEVGIRTGFLGSRGAGSPSMSPSGDGALDGERSTPEDRSAQPDDIGRFLQLGPLGTALLPYHYPRVLLIDEIDKSDLDFPGDLLNILEDGEFRVQELARLGKEAPEITVQIDDPDRTTVIKNGYVRCSAFPVIVMTSNGERDFPPAFYRRCIRVDLADPQLPELRRFVEIQLGETIEDSDALVKDFLRRRDEDDRPVAADQLLNAIYLRMSHLPPRGSLRDAVLRPIDGGEESGGEESGGEESGGEEYGGEASGGEE